MRETAWRIVAACMALSILGGCLPDKLVIDLNPSDGTLAETVVISDAPGSAGDASPKVALIDVVGLIADAPTPGLIGMGPSPVDTLVARLQKAERDPTVRAVVLRINSPGGTVTGSDLCYREVRRFAERTKKPVVASMSEVAASGGYYLSLAADEVIAMPTTITGSIGVIMQTFNFSEGMERFGIHARAVTSGPNKDLANPFVEEREDHYALLQGMVDEFYDRFRSLVLERRPALSKADFDRCTDGRVLSGEEAARIGLVDATGGLREAFEAAKSRAGLTTARLVKYHAPGDPPRSAYAASSTSAGANVGATAPDREINLVQLNLGAAGFDSAAFYYLWTPPRP